jgi:class 3 adenylate cyclase
MEPRIQYAKTSDSVNIAYWTMGEGPPLVLTAFVPWGIGYTLLQIPEVREWYERLSTGRLLVRYDARGTGHSDRNVTDFSLEAHLRDLDAVVERLALRQFALLGFYMTGPAAIAYAARHPDRVTHLILWTTFASARQYRNTLRYRAFESLRSMARDEWELYVRTMSSAPFPGADAVYLERRRQLMAESVRPNELLRMFDAYESHDAMEEAEAVQTPTLILHRREGQVVPMELARDLASRIPGAELVVLEGPDPIAEGDDQMLRAINAFLGLRAEQRETVGADLPSGTAVILFADIADSTALTERMGDAAFRETARALDDRLRAAVRAAGGTPVEGRLLGDGLMAVFASAREAIEAALRCNVVSGESELRLRVGVHAGDVIREEGNVFGGAVNIASRVADAASPGEVLVSQTVRDLARTSAGVDFEDRGERELKGVSEPVRLYEVRWRDGS